MYVTDPHQVAAFDAVFAEVFGGPVLGAVRARPDAATARRRADEHSPAGKDPGAGARCGEGSWTSRPARGGDSEDGDEIEVPLAHGERRGAAGDQAGSTRLEPHELAQLYGLMARPAAGHTHAAAPAGIGAAADGQRDRHAAHTARAACAPAAIRSGWRAVGDGGRRGGW